MNIPVVSDEALVEPGDVVVVPAHMAQQVADAAEACEILNGDNRAQFAAGVPGL